MYGFIWMNHIKWRRQRRDRSEACASMLSHQKFNCSCVSRWSRARPFFYISKLCISNGIPFRFNFFLSTFPNINRAWKSMEAKSGFKKVIQYETGFVKIAIAHVAPFHFGIYSTWCRNGQKITGYQCINILREISIASWYWQSGILNPMLFMIFTNFKAKIWLSERLSLK